MKKLSFLFALIALSINSCSDSSVDSSQQTFDGTVYYTSANSLKLYRISSEGKHEIKTSGYPVIRMLASPVENTLLYIINYLESIKGIVVSDFQGSNSAPALQSKYTFAAYSPISKNISYVDYNYEDSTNNIYRYNIIDKKYREIIVRNVFPKDVIFSPDGNKIAFFKGQFGDSLIISNSDGSNQEVLFTKVFPEFIDWSPDGEKIAYSVSGNIGVVNVITKENKTILTENKSKDDIKWMPDSKNIVYSYNTRSENIIETSIQMLDTETGMKKDLVTSPNLLLFPQVSPDGKSILYSEIPLGKMHLEGSLKILNLTTSQSVKIADDAYNGFWKR